MREYGQIQCSFWQRACEEEWSNDAMLLGAYLLTGPHSNGVGCYRLPTGYVCDDLGWGAERVEQTLSELSEKGFCNRFGRVVLVPKFLRWNSISNGNVAKARQQEFEAIPNDDAKRHAARALLDFGNHWEHGFIKRLETLSKGLPKQNPTLPNPNQPKPTQSEGDGTPPPPKKKTDPTPYQEITEAYNRLCPSLKTCRALNDKRKRRMRKLWQSLMPTLEHWEAYFADCEATDAYAGRFPPRPPYDEPFKADLDFLLRDETVTKVLER